MHNFCIILLLGVNIICGQGSLDSGTVFDSSRQSNRGPFAFVLGQNKVIQGQLSTFIVGNSCYITMVT